MKIILKYWREIVIAVLIIVVLSSVRTCSNKQDDISLLEKSRDSAYYKATYYKNKEGELIGQIKTFEVTNKQLKEYGDQLGFENEGLKKQVGKLTNLVAHYKGKVGMRDTIEVVNHDTIYSDRSGDLVKGKWFFWSNNFLSLDGVTTDKTTSIAYNYDVSFELTSYRKGKTLFKPGQLVTDIKFNDPNMKVTEFKGFVVTEDKPKFYQRRSEEHT